jgi:hypothetical protein
MKLRLMANMIRIHKRALVSTCLLLVLASGAIMQIIGQLTLSVAVCIDLEGGTLQVLVNDVPYCILLDEGPLTAARARVTSKALPSAGNPETFPLIGDVYQGACDDPGSMFGHLTGTLILEDGSSPNELIVESIFTLTGTPTGTIHSESKFTAELLVGPPFYLKNVKLGYAYIESNGVRVNLLLLKLEPASGEIIFDTQTGVICLPTFIFSFGAPVGGIVMPTDKLEVLTPYLALAGLLAVSAVAAVKKRRD